MQLVYGDFWQYEADFHVITTNGDVRKDGACVMGRGVAEQAKGRFPHLPYVLGGMLKENGNVVQDLGEWGRLGERAYHLWAFPVKHHWRDQADLALIEQSVLALQAAALHSPASRHKRFVLVRPGVGNGQRHWAEVEPLVACLPDNVHVIDFPRGGQ